jgi:F-type H+-transporting ATPase subunit delta
VALRGAAARRYAQAVFDIAKQTNTLDRWLSDLKVLDGIFGNQMAVSVMADPSTKLEDASRIIAERVPEGTVSPLALNLLKMLVQRQRLGLLPRILESFSQLYNREKQIVIADVTSAVPLDEAHQQRVKQQLSQITGKTVELRLHQDPAILGGLVAQIGDQLIDASVASRLSALAERLA